LIARRFAGTLRGSCGEVAAGSEVEAIRHRSAIPFEVSDPIREAREIEIAKPMGLAHIHQPFGAGGDAGSAFISEPV